MIIKVHIHFTFFEVLHYWQDLSTVGRSHRQQTHHALYALLQLRCPVNWTYLWDFQMQGHCHGVQWCSVIEREHCCAAIFEVHWITEGWSDLTGKNRVSPISWCWHHWYNINYCADLASWTKNKNCGCKVLARSGLFPSHCFFLYTPIWSISLIRSMHGPKINCNSLSEYHYKSSQS